MGTSLNGLTPANTYQGLIKFGDNSALTSVLKALSDGNGNDTMLELSTTALQIGGSTGMYWDNTNKRLGVGFNTPTARLQVRGSGSTSATTALLVQNSAGTNLLNVRDDLSVLIASQGIFVFGDTSNYAKKSSAIDGVEIAGFGGVGLGAFGGINTFVVRSGSASLGATTANASAILDIVSTTKGVLFPRMTTTQKNAISSPAAGLQVYDTTLNQMSYYNGSSWINF
jgi:hypothetical protein